MTDESQITAYCDGDPNLTCDNQRESSTGLCHAVPVPDVCEGPVGDGVIEIDTTSLSGFDFIEDNVTLTAECDWNIGPDGVLRQSSNANRNQGILLGCNAIVKDLELTDFLLQVDILNDDDDGVGLNFGWRSEDDFFRLHKINDIWPNPASDYVNGPGLKVKKKIPGVYCWDFDQINATADLCFETLSFADSFGIFHDSLPTGTVAPFEYATVYAPYSEDDLKRLVLIIRDNALRVIYEDVTTEKYVGSFVFDLTKYNWRGGRVGLFTWAHTASFHSFLAAPLSGAGRVTEFCNGGICDERTGLCSTQPTSFPTSRSGTVPLADVCPGPVGGDTVIIDTTDLSEFIFIDQAPLSDACSWETTNSGGLRQTSSAWGNYPGASTTLGCIALLADRQYTDFMLEVTAIHDDGASTQPWGLMFGYDGMGTEPENIIALVNNDANFPSNPDDGIFGPSMKLKATNGRPCLADASTSCYDTLSFVDSFGQFIIDGVQMTDVPGEYSRRYLHSGPWPREIKLTLIVKDGSAKLMMLSPSKDFPTDINGQRQPSQWVSTWTSEISFYQGGLIGLFAAAHAVTFTDVTVTDLTNLPSEYCNGEGLCADGVCTRIPVSDVCEDPVDATVIDTRVLTAFEYIDDVGLNAPCQWVIQDLGKGPFLYQMANSHADMEGLGCNALYRGGSFTDFLLQVDVDNFDNDGVGLIFGYQSDLDHCTFSRLSF